MRVAKEDHRMSSESLVAYVNMTSTAGGIMPLVEIDGRPIGDGKPGPVSQRIHGLYWALRESGRHGTPIFPEASG
jgi:branched-chain amino acid aminotransferase